MSESPSFEKAVLDLSLKIAEMAGDIKLVLLQVSNSDEKHRDSTRRIDKNEADISSLRTELTTVSAQAVTPKKMWAAIGVLTAIAAVFAAVIAIVLKT